MHTTTPHRRLNWRQSTARAVVIGTIAATVVGSAASAEPPYPPDESDEQGTFPDQPDDDWGDSSGTDNSDTDIEPPVLNDTIVLDTTSSPAGTWNDHVETDLLKITDRGIDFGDTNWGGGILNDPLGPGSVEWSVDDGFTARSWSAPFTSTASRDSTAACTSSSGRMTT